MIAFSEPVRIRIINDRPGTMCGTDYVSDTTTGDTDHYTELWADNDAVCYRGFEDYIADQVDYSLYKKKRGKKPIICQDAAMPMYRLEERPVHRPVQILNRRMMFDKSGYLPKRIRRIRK